MKQRCAFCSQTSKKGLVFYKGLLSTLICSECVEAIVSAKLTIALGKMEFKSPLDGKGRKV